MAIGEQFELPNCQLREFFLLLTSARRRFRVTGLSMFPCLVAGEEVIAQVKAYELQINDIVVLSHPLRPHLIMIKRIKEVKLEPKTGKKSYFVQGDNISVSIDSRHFGWINEDLIIGKVICRFP